MSNQLIKTTGQGKENVFPRTRIQDLYDDTSGQKLTDILRSFNMMFVPYLGNKSYTRNQISPELRRQGLWLTYVIDNTVYTEWYGEVAIDDTNWGSDSNWRQGSNALVGDLSISPNGTWVINGEDSGITIKGDKGDSPVIRIYDNKIQVSYDKGVTYEDLNNTPVYTKFRFNSQTNTYQVSYDLGANWQDISDEKVYHKFKYNQATNTYQESLDFGNTWFNITSDKVYYRFRTEGNRLQVSTDLGANWNDCSEPIAAWFRWASGDSADSVGKIQISRDEQNTWNDLSPNMVNNLRIKKYVTTINNLPKDASLGDIYMVGPTYDTGDTKHDYPHYRMWIKQSSGWVDNGEYQSNVLVTQNIINNTSTGNVPSTQAVRNHTNKNGIINVSTNYNTSNNIEVLNLDQAIFKIPLKDKVLGLQIKFLTTEGWKSYIYDGNSIEDWLNTDNWKEQIISTSLEQQLGDDTTKTMSQAAITNAINEQVSTVEAAKNEAVNTIKQTEQTSIANFNKQRVTPEMLSESTKQLIESSGGGTITNLPDDEDITSVDDGTGGKVLKFKDKSYDTNNFSSEGRVIVRKNIVNGKNILTSSMINNPNNVYIIKYDFELVDIIWLSGPTILLGEGGSINCNGFKVHNIIFKNLKVTNCGDNNIYGAIYSHFDNCVLFDTKYLGYQRLHCVSLDIMKYIKDTPDIVFDSKRNIDLNVLLDNIYSGLGPIDNSTSYVIELPNGIIQSGAGFCVSKPITIKNNITLKGFTIRTTPDFEGDHVISYESNTKYKNIVGGKIVDCTINITTTTHDNIKTVFDLTNFNSILENIIIELGNKSAFAFVQPFGTSTSSYSDMKYIRGVSVRKTTDTLHSRDMPKTIFVYGDGCIIEQCRLGGVAILHGKSYAINNCLNDSYFIYNSNVQFNSDYFEVGQFKFLNSNVSFNGCQLHFDNMSTFGNRNYYGSLFEIDTENVKNIMNNLLKIVGCSKFYTQINHSKVFFNGSNILQMRQYWFLEPKYSGHLIEKDSNSQVIIAEGLIDKNNFVLDTQSPYLQNITFNSIEFIKDCIDNSVDYSNNITYNFENILDNNVNSISNAGIDWTEEECNIDSILIGYLSLSTKRRLYFKVGERTFKPENKKFQMISISNANRMQLRGICILQRNGINYIVASDNLPNTSALLYNNESFTTVPESSSVSSIFKIAKADNGISNYVSTSGAFTTDNPLIDILLNTQYNECKKLDILGNNNVRAYLSAIPTYGEWNKNDECVVNNITYIYDGNNWRNKPNLSGSTALRPQLVDIGYQYFDTTLNKPIFWNGENWVDYTGNVL